jgi:hypothetical protein
LERVVGETSSKNTDARGAPWRPPSLGRSVATLDQPNLPTATTPIPLADHVAVLGVRGAERQSEAGSVVAVAISITAVPAAVAIAATVTIAASVVAAPVVASMRAKATPAAAAATAAIEPAASVASRTVEATTAVTAAVSGRGGK